MKINYCFTGKQSIDELLDRAIIKLMKKQRAYEKYLKRMRNTKKLKR